VYAAWLKNLQQTNNEEIILVDTKEQIATDALKLAYRKLKLDYDELFKKHQSVDADNEKYRKQNKQYQTIVETAIRSDLEKKILARGDFTQADLEVKKIEELQTIAETLSKSKGMATVYKGIRAGTASEKEARSTVGSLYMKSRKEILDSGGEF